MNSYKNQLDSLDTQISSSDSNNSNSYDQKLGNHYKKPSILKRKTHDKNQNNQRNDNFGLPIEKNGKHKVCFKNPLLTEHEVESWKEYNVDVHEENVCSCKIF